MAVVSNSLQLLWRGQTASRSGNSDREYTAVYRLRTTDPRDGSAVVLSSNQLPSLGSFYSFGNDVDTLATLQELSPSRVEGLRTLWEVVAKWSTKQPDGGTDNNGNPTDDPLKFRPEVRVYSQQITKPVEESQLLTKIPNFNVGQFILPCNSAGVPFHPPREMLCSQHVVRVTRNEEKYNAPQAETFINSINEDDFTIQARGLNLRVKKYQARMNQIGAIAKRAFNKDYFEMEYELIVDPDGWRVRIADRGLHAKAEPGDPAGNGGADDVISPSDVKPGQPRVRRIADKDGQPVAVPVFLDGNGQPLQPGQPIFYITYADYLELPFAQLGL